MSVQDLILAVRQAGDGAGGMGPIIAVAVVVVVLVMVAIGAVFLLYAASPRGKIDALLDERASTAPVSKWPTRIAAVVMIVVVTSLGAWQMDNPKQCAQCHKKVDYSKSLAASPHKDVKGCMACHGERGITGIAVNSAKYSRWLLVYAGQKKVPSPKPGSVRSDQCIRCHREILGGTVERYGVRVRHKDFLEQGDSCRECHNSVAHGETVKQPSKPTMNKCIVCHDGKKARNECALCHVQEPGTYDVRDGALPKIKQVNSGDCYSCHDERPCTSCHGVTMPHPEGWVPTGGINTVRTHAYEGFKNRESCWRCHFAKDKPLQPSNESCRCHGLFGKMHGGEAWIAEHGKQATGVKPGSEAECYMCHDGRYFCTLCHPASYMKKYKPVNGYSDYERDIPYDPEYWEY